MNLIEELRYEISRTINPASALRKQCRPGGTQSHLGSIGS